MLYVNAIAMFSGLFMVLSAWLMISERFLVNYGICRLDINAGEKPLEVNGGQTLLASLYANEIFIPSACGGKGTCGFCKITVTEGGGPVLPTETPYLTRKEIRSNVRLACQVKIREDIFVRIPEELLSIRMFSATVESTIDLTYDIKEIRFKLIEPDEISFGFGQYVQIQAPSSEGPVFRAYSISSPICDKNIIELNVRLIPGGVASTYLCNLQAGDPVNFTGPYGDFILNEDPSVELVCVGGGVGMAPMNNILYSIYDRWPEKPCWLFFGCRTTRDIFYLKEFKELSKKHPAFKVIYALSDQLGEDEKWDGETGFIHLSVDKYLEKDKPRQAFLCGPPLMIDAVTKVLLGKGLSNEQIFFDDFGP